MTEVVTTTHARTSWGRLVAQATAHPRPPSSLPPHLPARARLSTGHGREDRRQDRRERPRYRGAWPTTTCAGAGRCGTGSDITDSRHTPLLPPLSLPAAGRDLSRGGRGEQARSCASLLFLRPSSRCVFFVVIGRCGLSRNDRLIAACPSEPPPPMTLRARRRTATTTTCDDDMRRTAIVAHRRATSSIG